MRTPPLIDLPPAHPHPVRRPPHWHRPLVLMASAMAVLTLVAAGGLVFDDRELLGAPIWLKPMKFGISLAVYGFTLAWLLSLPHKGSRWTWWLGTMSALILFVDIGIVFVQAARGTLSHFNTSDDPLNQAMQGTFGLSIPVLFLANVALALVLSFQRLGSRSTSWAIRAGMGLAVTGMALGYLMFFQLGKELLVHDAAGNDIQMAGGHSVGVPDGGAGMPLTGWSTTGGDLRIPHFVGMHGLQFMLLVALALGLLAKRYGVLREESTRAGLVGVVAVGYVGLLATVTWQALRGEPLIHPSGQTLFVLGGLALLVALGSLAVLRRARA